MKIILCIVALLGTVLAAPGGRIIGGTDAARGDFPQIVSLQYCILSFCQHSCGATILNQKWVLTAAHCLTELPGIGSLSGVAGILNLDENNPERRTFTINRFIIHPEYKGGVNPHDIALIELTSPLEYNDYIQPAKLPSSGETPDGDADIAGWGSVGGIIIPQMPNTLQTVNVPVLDIEACDNALNQILDGQPHPLDAEANFCTGPLYAPISTCNGDSGGPIFQGDTVIGAVSWGISPCGLSGAPSVQVKVSSYVDWINDIIGEPAM